MYKSRGFTLIETMFVVVIIGILAAIAYPSYGEYLAKARRTDAQAALLELAQFMERYYTVNGRYVDGDGDPPALPFVEAPKDGGTKAYALGFVAAVSATAYTLEAVPKGPMSGDRCGSLRLSSIGVKSIAGAHAGVTPDQCWQR